MRKTKQIELPRLLLIGDGFTQPAVASRIRDAVHNGVRWVQLRDHEANDIVFAEAAVRLADDLLRITSDVIITVNSRMDAMAPVHGGLHVGTRGPSPKTAREHLGPDLLLGTSIHSIDEAVPREVDYLIWSPVYPTRSKPGDTGTGITGLKEACTHAKGIPVIAMGGITPVRALQCINAGAYGVAVLSGLLRATYMKRRINAYLAALNAEAV